MVHDVKYNHDTVQLKNITIASPMHVSYTQMNHVAHYYTVWEKVIK